MVRSYFSSSERRLMILHAAGELMVRRSLPEVTMPDVAKESGLSIGGLYRHFASKEELIDALVTADAESQVQKLQSIADRKTPLQDRITKWALHQVKREVDAQTLKLRLEILAMAARNETVAQALALHETALSAQLLGLFKQASPDSLAAQNPSLATALLWTLIDGLATRGAVSVKAIKSSRLLIHHMVTSLLRPPSEELEP
jgi:AcrR family transcriptional regulator